MNHRPIFIRRRLDVVVAALVATGLVAMGLVATGLVIVLLSAGNASSVEDRQREIAERGTAVMPFDLDATTHRWTPVVDGLVQTVVADDPNDPEQVTLIRAHLRSETDRFRGGDFSDPAAIHGETMPGLALLRSQAGRIAITYEEVAGGARLIFATTETILVDALHGWGEAQLSDHGPHAEMG